MDIGPNLTAVLIVASLLIFFLGFLFTLYKLNKLDKIKPIDDRFLDDEKFR